MRTLVVLFSILGIVTVLPFPISNKTAFLNERGPWEYKFEGEDIIGDNLSKDCYEQYFDCAKIITVPQIVCGKAWYWRILGGYYESKNYASVCQIEFINCVNRLTDTYNTNDSPKFISDGRCVAESIWHYIFNSLTWLVG